MKMPFFRTTNPYRRSGVLLTPRRLATAAASGVVVLGSITVQLFVPGFLVTVFTPLWSAGTGLANGLSDFTALFGNAGELTRERDLLQSENLSLNEENRTLRAQVTDLTGLMGTAAQPEKRILAGVLARPPVAPYDTIVVDKGSDDGVREGAFAFGQGGVPLGTMVSVAPHSSRIELFSTSGNVTDGWVGDKRLPLTLTGRGGGAFAATVPRASGIEVHAVVYVPGPGALPIGTVARIDSDPSSPRDTVHIAPYVNLYSLTWVEIAPHA